MKQIHYLMFMVLLCLMVNASAQTGTTAFAYQKPLFDFDEQKITFKLEGEQLTNQSKFLRFSVVTGYREGIKPIKGAYGMTFGAYADPVTGTSRIAMFNLSIRDLLAIGLKADQIILEVIEPSRYAYDPKYGNEQEWLRKNGWCYEFVLPIGTFPTANLFDFVRADLAAQFNLKVVKEKRMSDNQHRYGLATGVPNKEVDVYLITEQSK